MFTFIQLLDVEKLLSVVTTAEWTVGDCCCCTGQFAETWGDADLQGSLSFWAHNLQKQQLDKMMNTRGKTSEANNYNRAEATPMEEPVPQQVSPKSEVSLRYPPPINVNLFFYLVTVSSFPLPHIRQSKKATGNQKPLKTPSPMPRRPAK